MSATDVQPVNAMPASTWYRLKMNDATVEIPEGLTQAPSVRVEADAGVIADASAFNAVVDEIQKEFNAERKAHPLNAALAGDSSSSVSETAYSRYQIEAARTEAAGSIAQTFDTGMGSAAREFLSSYAHENVVVASKPGEHARATVRIDGTAQGIACALVDVAAAANSTVELTVAFDSPAEGTGVVGASVRVAAAAGATVRVSTINTARDTYTVLDDEGYMLAAGARAEIANTVLGGHAAYVGVAADLRGTGSTVDASTRYLGHADNEIDINYILRHHGRETTSEYTANGVLTGESTKTLRGTIDLIKGAKGAVGHEAETVLIADERAHNRTVPVILCSEDDVMGNHGATIGHIQPEQLFYLATRGLSAEAAEDLFVRATFEAAAISAPDDETRDNIVRLGSELLGQSEEA